MLLKRLFLSLSFICIAQFGHAQKAPWPPEVSQLYIQARDYLANNKLQQAIITYKQAIALMPKNMLLYRDLAKAYYSATLYTDAEQTIAPLIKNKDADDQCYQVMAMAEAGGGDRKKARHTLEEGISHFPSSGILYHDLGKWHDDNNDPEKALGQWLLGIEQDPTYHLNYYEAAVIYSHTEHPVWVILYGEAFVNMEQQTQRSTDTRKMVLDAYQKLYSSILTKEVPAYGGTNDVVQNFEGAVKDVYRKLSPEVKDGINMNSLTALRSRFLMEWKANYASKYPYTLFQYQDKLIAGEYYDIYNEWLFGQVLNAAAYDKWKQTNSGALDALNNWFGSNPLLPTRHDFYDDENMKGVFSYLKQ